MTSDALIVSIAMAMAAGLVGSFAVMRRMSLAGDALSHVALPGIGIALALGIHPVFGAAAMLFFGALLVWAVQERSRMATETTIGVVFSTALADGGMITSGEDLIDALFGGAGTMTAAEMIFGLAGASAVVAFIVTQRDRLTVMLVSGDVARTAGINVRIMNLLYLQAFALTTALGLRYLGVLMMGALIIIPPATAKRVARNLTQMLWVSAAVAVFSTAAGHIIASWLHRETGPVIVTVAALCFVASLFRSSR
jgi:ABC-type Mn2+/Zn2+ transport system permease subunit